MTRTVLIMAGGTGGHIFPALSIARVLQELGCRVEWLGTAGGMEADLLRDTGIPLHLIEVRGLRGKGMLGLLKAPFMILKAVAQARRVIRQLQPCCVLGMGGYVTGPGGVAARIARRPLLIHEQNAMAGMSNRLLSRIANRVLETFPGTFRDNDRVICTGNPVRNEISRLHEQTARQRFNGDRLNMLVLGGSLGAKAINTVIPEALKGMPADVRPRVWHQTGRDKYFEASAEYDRHGLPMDGEECYVAPFIEDMAAAYEWADIVVCRAGATTVSELAVAGLPSVLIPFPFAVDDHQRINAQWLSKAGAAVLVDQKEFTTTTLTELLERFSANRGLLQGMADSARTLARPEAAQRVATLCLEECHVA